MLRACQPEAKELVRQALGALVPALPKRLPQGDHKYPIWIRYTKKILSGQQAALEFETTVEGKVVNGIDIITCDAEGKITEFKVMIRPLQGVQAVHRQMKAMLESMQS